MRIFGLDIRRAKAAVAPVAWPLTTTSLGGWWPVVRESFAGAWQRNVVDTSPENLLTFSAVYACVTLIAADIAKLRIKLVTQDAHGIWTETESAAFSPVLRKPNHFQTRIKFIEQWMTSKLIHGNTYVLKARDERRVVTRLYVLDPTRVKPLVSPDGAVYYAIGQDNLSGIEASNVVVPASEIIHDVMVPLFHPLCGVSPLTACGLAAVQGLRVQQNSASFFANGSRPGGILTSPIPLEAEQANDIKKAWEDNFSGDNQGRVAVLGADLKYQEMGINAVDAQLIEQLKWTQETVCTAYHVPPFKIGVAPPPATATVEALNIQYYSQCLQAPIESIELLLDEGLGLDRVPRPRLGTEFDLDALLRMDTASRVKAAADAIGSGGMSPNEGRARFLDLPPTDGGAGPYLQQQNYSLAALAKRDAQADPFGMKAPAPVEAPGAAEPEEDDVVRAVDLWEQKSAEMGLHAA